VSFRGLAVPGCVGVSATDDLVAIWKTAEGQRFQNYRAYFTVLDVQVVPRVWIRDVLGGKPLSPSAPEVFARWVQSGHYTPLEAERSISWRSKGQQLPTTAEGCA